jgi:hypothetical protein
MAAILDTAHAEQTALQRAVSTFQQAKELATATLHAMTNQDYVALIQPGEKCLICS